MKNMTLGRMAEACGGIYCGKDEDRDREVCSITTDSRKAEPGCLFAAIRGERVDGHDFIDQVFEMGALCVITEEDIPQIEEHCAVNGAQDVQGHCAMGGDQDMQGLSDSKNITEPAHNYIKVDSTIKALGALAAYYLEQLAIPVVGVTGSVGKTSTKEMIAAVLSQKYRTLKTAGNFNNELGLPLTIFRLRDEDEIAVLEMGINHFGEMHVLAQIAKPDTCVITNIGQCHLEFLGDRDGVLRAKTEIFGYLRPDGHVILNGDDDKLSTVQEVRVPGVYTHSSAKSSHNEKEPAQTEDLEGADNAKSAENAKNVRGGEGAAKRTVRPVFFGLNTDNDIYADQIEKKGLDGIKCRICVKQKDAMPSSAGSRRASLQTAVATADSSTVQTAEAAADSSTEKIAETVADSFTGQTAEAAADSSTVQTAETAADSFTVQIPIPGVHMVRNALAATAVGLHYGLTLEEIRAGIESLQPVSGRFHIIHTEHFTIIDDCYNANPVSMKASLEVLQDGLHRKVAILGDMGELGPEEARMHHEVGTFAGGLAIDLCICAGPLAAKIAEGVQASNSGIETVTLSDLSALLEQLQSLVKEGDTILVKASHFMHFEKVVAKLREMK
ncbi:MAG: UDP-N-acetylmuramoyl-tripeptide--D-alanyl-D-alanine ligase [Lachnospiraceae bacterium]|nr:UDP-N-acetylmuramoyl-tripeptide--D-alanyl-D-alanine ligase [Lachnospiraceae bacterium]